MDNLIFSIDESTGDVTFLVDESTRPFIDETSVINRASNVEPVFLPLRFAYRLLRSLFDDSGRVAAFTRHWPCLWRVNLAPVNGPILPDVFADRQTAINAEITWLEENFL